MYLAGIPDLLVTIEEMVAEGDKVAVRRTCEGTHRGELLGIPPTGKHVRVSGISIFCLTRGKIAEQWEQLDQLALMRQLGVLPTPGAGSALGPQPGCPATSDQTDRGAQFAGVGVGRAVAGRNRIARASDHPHDRPDRPSRSVRVAIRRARALASRSSLRSRASWSSAP
jgi:SnoaL-like polyketide cyclase